MKDIPELLAVVFHLRALRRGRIPSTHGQIIHGAFISLLSDLFPRLPHSLHEGNSSPRPFTLSHLHGPPDRQKNSSNADTHLPGTSIPINEGEDYWFRITSLSKEMSVLLLSFCQAPASHIQLAHLPFQLVGISPSGHKRSGQDTYRRLWDEKNIALQKSKSILGFYFLSPTAFHSQKRNHLFPLPSMIFPQLISRWNRFSSIEFPDLPKTLFDQSLIISAYHLHTHILDFGRAGKQIGFEGYCEYKMEPQTDREVTRLIHLLGLYSFFSGIGYGTPKGMGQVEFVIP